MNLARNAAKAIAWGLRRAGLTIAPLNNDLGGIGGVRIEWAKNDARVLHGALVTAHESGSDVRFFISSERDSIQRVHRSGRFYEAEELDIISRHFKGGVFVDIGANVGNHTIYAAKILGATKIIAFEPLPEALKVLRANISINGLEDRVLLHPVALSDRDGAASMISPVNNIGGSRIDIIEAGNVSVRRGDDLLKNNKVDFIKIDIEGHEMLALEGLSDTIQRYRPPIFVEVEDENIQSFYKFCEKMGYKAAEDFRRYPGRINIMSVYQGF